MPEAVTLSDPNGNSQTLSQLLGPAADSYKNTSQEFASGQSNLSSRITVAVGSEEDPDGSIGHGHSCEDP